MALMFISTKNYSDQCAMQIFICFPPMAPKRKGKPEDMKTGVSPLYCSRTLEGQKSCLRKQCWWVWGIFPPPVFFFRPVEVSYALSSHWKCSYLVVVGQLWKSKLPPDWFLQSSSSRFCSWLLLCHLPAGTLCHAQVPTSVPLSACDTPVTVLLFFLPPCSLSSPLHVLPGCRALGLIQAVLKNLPPYPIKLKNNIIPRGHFRVSLLPWQVNSFYESPATILFYLSKARSNRNVRNLLQMSTPLVF